MGIAVKHHKSAAQVLLRWGVDKGVSVIPGCTSRAHLKEALDVASFNPLGEADMKALMKYRGNAECWSTEYTFDYCCDSKFGYTGNVNCWSGPYSYSSCCVEEKK